jgi:uncharacterized protein (DUF2141 family)
MKGRTVAMAVSALLLATAPALAEEGCVGRGDTRITVLISGMEAERGEIAVTLYPDDARRFLAPRGKLLRQRLPTHLPVTTACFLVANPGVYAVAVYHDANRDQDFNRSRIGMPTEGFGFSNDAPTRFGLPSFDAVRFKANSGETRVAVKMRYQR